MNKRLLLAAFVCLFFFSMSNGYGYNITLGLPGVDPVINGDTNLIDPTLVDDEITLDVIIEDVYDITGFDLDMKFNADVATVKDIKLTDYLASTGNEIKEAKNPTIDNTLGRIEWWGAIAVQPDFRGPDGSGVLAQIIFDLDIPVDTNDAVEFEIARFVASDEASKESPPGDKIKAQITPAYSFTASTDGNGTVSPAATTVQAEGVSMSFTIMPQPCHQIKDVTVDGQSVGAVSDYTFPGNDTNAHTIHAIFEIIQYDITTNASEGGEITTDVTVDCGADTSIGIIPADCFRIIEITNNGESVMASADLTMNDEGVALYKLSDIHKSHQIAAVFEKIELTFQSVENAEIRDEGGQPVDPSQSLCASYGTTRTFTFEPDAEFNITDIVLDGESMQGSDSLIFNTDGTVTVTLTDIQKSHALQPAFALKGDINSDETVDLKDVILSLKVLTGVDTGDETVSANGDANGDQRIGLEESVYSLKYVSESADF
jgi:hypothetical protein